MVVMDHLSNPRGIAIGPDGGIYVAESGVGGTLGSFTNDQGVQHYGTSGSVSRSLNGTQSRVYTNLPSLLPDPAGAGASGPGDLAFDASGKLNIINGLGANPSVRGTALNNLPSSSLLGQIVRPTSGTTYAPFSDVAGYEAAHDPDGGGVDSNPYGLTILPGGRTAAVDAGGNDLLLIDSTGKITQSVVFPTQANPLPFGPPVYEAVPTHVVIGPDGKLYVSELSGFPFPVGGANIEQVDPNAANPTPVAFATGLTTLSSLQFGPDGNLYALEIDKNGLANPSGFGRLIRIAHNGTQTVVADNLPDPTGLAISSNGTIYASINGTSPTDGEVVRLSASAAVPLPAAVWAMLATLPMVLVFASRLRTQTA